MSEVKKNEKPLVKPVAMPKIKLSRDKFTLFNTLGVVAGLTLGYTSIFAAIAGFTKGKWGFNLPIFHILFGSNLADVSSGLVAALLAILAGVVGLLTMKRLTDAEGVKSAWLQVSRIFMIATAIYLIDLVAIAIYSLLSLGRSYYNQGYLWLNGFLSTTLLALGAAAISVLAKKIADGKIEILRILGFVAMGLASLAMLLTFVQILVGFYSGSSSDSNYRSNYNESGLNVDQLEDSLRSLKGLFK